MIIGILATMGVPRFAITVEQARLDAAATALVTVHAAQRIYWLETAEFAPSLDALIDAKLLDPTLRPGADARYLLSIESASTAEFRAVAARKTGEAWTGSIAITQEGVVTGQVSPGQASSLPVLRPLAY